MLAVLGLLKWLAEPVELARSLLRKAQAHRFQLLRPDDGQVRGTSRIVSRVQKLSDDLLQLIAGEVVWSPAWPALKIRSSTISITFSLTKRMPRSSGSSPSQETWPLRTYPRGDRK